MRSRREALLALFVLLLAACSAGPPRPAPATIVIGVDLPLTGAQARDAQAALDEVRQVVDGTYGGRVEGLPVSLRVFDESPAGSRDPVAAAHQLELAIASTPLLGVVGPLDSDVAAAEMPSVSAAHLAMVSPSAANACLTRALPECDGLAHRLRGDGPPAFFRVAPPDDGEAAALVQFAATQLQATSFAVGSDGQAYGLLVQARFQAALKARRLPAVYSANVDPSSPAAIDGFLAGARQAGADAVLFGGRAEGGACRLAPRLSAGLGTGAALLGGSGLLGSTCPADAGDQAASVYSIAEGSPSEAGLAARVLMGAIATAVKAQGGNLPTREQVRAAVAQNQLFPFDGEGDPRSGTYEIYQAGAAGWTDVATIPRAPGS